MECPRSGLSAGRARCQTMRSAVISTSCPIRDDLRFYLVTMMLADVKVLVNGQMVGGPHSRCLSASLPCSPQLPLQPRCTCCQQVYGLTHVSSSRRRQRPGPGLGLDACHAGVQRSQGQQRLVASRPPSPGRAESAVLEASLSGKALQHLTGQWWTNKAKRYGSVWTCGWSVISNSSAEDFGMSRAGHPAYDRSPHLAR